MAFRPPSADRLNSAVQSALAGDTQRLRCYPARGEANERCHSLAHRKSTFVYLYLSLAKS